MRPYRLCRPFLFALPAESAHNLTHRVARAIADGRVERYLADRLPVRDDRLAVEAFGTRFPNPVGVAAGFDKNAHLPGLLGSLGFGHVEIGAVTARPQSGNPRPRLFRLREDQGLINRMGFPNDGAERIARRLEVSTPPTVPLGVNIGKSKAVADERAPADYRYTYERLAAHGDFFVINVSSPNTPGLRGLQRRGPLGEIIGALQEASAAPLLVKISPDLDETGIETVIEIVHERGLDGIVVANTTVDRPTGLRSPQRRQTGGLSGKPLEAAATQAIAYVAKRTDVPIIGVGGIFTAADAYRKLRAGATVVQLYTGIVYRGPGVAREINRGLLTLLERDGFGSVTEAVGVDHE